MSARDESGEPSLEGLPQGAAWCGVDLHLHSPGVSSFSYPEGGAKDDHATRSYVARLYAERLHTAGIRVAGLTDYNGVRPDWYAAIRDASADMGIVVLPGAEISFTAGKHGLHVLAIFSAATKPEEVNRFLNSLDRDPARLLFEGRDSRDIVPKEHVATSLQQLKQRFDCLLIFPHPDQRNGLCRSFQAKEAAEILEVTRPDAIEHCSDSAIQSLRSTHVLRDEVLDRLARVEFSDPKSIAEIGSKTTDGEARLTWVKLSAFDVDALRLAFHDPEVRIRREPPPLYAYGKVAGLAIDGSGFLNRTRLRFNPELNTLIGGRGAGKSALIETLRYALEQEPYTEPTYRNELIRYALGSGGKVSVFIERPVEGRAPHHYRVDRVLGERSRVFELGPTREVQLKPTEVLGPRAGIAIFGQREIYAVATVDQMRLRLLDELIGDQARDAERGLRLAIDGVDKNATALKEAQRQLQRREEFEQRLRTIENEISLFERYGVADKLRNATDLRTDEQAFDRAVAALSEIGEAGEDAAATAISLIDRAAAELSRPKSSAKPVLAKARVVFERLKASITSGRDATTLAIQAARTELKQFKAELDASRKPVESDLLRIKRELQSDDLDPDRLMKLTEERNSILPAIEQLEALGARAAELREQRDVLLNRMRDARREVHRLRREACDRMNDELLGSVRLQVLFKGQRSDFGRRLTTLVRGSGLTADAIERLTDAETSDGLAISEAIRMGAQAVRERFELTIAMAERLIAWFQQDEGRLLQLETEQVEDSVDVALRVDTVYRSLDRLSMGQKSTAILLLLLARTERQLVLDQPEDDLDNRFVYEDIVAILRRQKGQRQLIVATHNANIPVLGDSELIQPLEAIEGKVRLMPAGSLDAAEVRAAVKLLMEGGEEAFHRRAEKYGAAS